MPINERLLALVDQGRLFWRIYDVRYSHPQAFHEDHSASSGMAVPRLAPLKYSLGGGGLLFGHEYQLSSQRRDLAVDFAAPLWALALGAVLVLACCFAPLLWSPHRATPAAA